MINTFLRITSVLAVLISCHLWPVPLGAEEKLLTVTEKIMGAARLREGVKTNFVYYDQLQIDWDDAFAQAISEIIATEDTCSYLRALQHLAAMAGDGHTCVWMDDSIYRKNISPAPFTTKLMEGRVLVNSVLSSFLGGKGVRKGTEVVSINGRPVKEYAETELQPYIFSSTPQWSNYKMFNEYGLPLGNKSDNIIVVFRNGNETVSAKIGRRFNGT